jgi:hypothetical protein
MIGNDKSKFFKISYDFSLKKLKVVGVGHKNFDSKIIDLLAIENDCYLLFNQFDFYRNIYGHFKLMDINNEKIVDHRKTNSFIYNIKTYNDIFLIESENKIQGLVKSFSI